MTLLRTLFFVLLAANLLFLIGGRSLFGGVPAGEPGRLAAQIDPEKIRIVPPGEAQGPVRPEFAADASQPAAAPAGEAPSAERCVALAGLNAEQVGALKAKLQADDVVKMQERSQDGSSYWVNIPPSPDRETAVRRAEEVRGQGVSGAFVIREEGEHRHAVSLGLFKTETAAQEFMRQLQAKGVQGARITARPAAGARITLTMRGPAERVAELAELALAANTNAKRETCAAR